MKPSLSLILERARAILKNALTRVINELSLPAYLLEGVLLDLLAEVRAQKATELAAELENAIKQIPPPADEQDKLTPPAAEPADHEESEA